MCHNRLHTYSLRQPSMLLAAIFKSAVHAQGALGKGNGNARELCKEKFWSSRAVTAKLSGRSWGRSDEELHVRAAWQLISDAADSLLAGEKLG